MLKPESQKIITKKIKYFEDSGIEILNLLNDKHFISELTMSIMVMETEGINSVGSYPKLSKKVKEFVTVFIKMDSP